MNELIDYSTLINSHLYFAYGSNLDPEQMQWRCPDAIALGPALLENWAWRIGGRGYATVSPSPGHHVWGAIWNVSDADLASLDRYEGVAGGHYRREFVTVMAQNQPVELLLYIENYEDHGSPRPDYLERIIAGARWFDLPQAWIANLTAIEAA